MKLAAPCMPRGVLAATLSSRQPRTWNIIILSSLSRRYSTGFSWAADSYSCRWNGMGFRVGISMDTVPTEQLPRCPGGRSRPREVALKKYTSNDLRLTCGASWPSDSSLFRLLAVEPLCKSSLGYGHQNSPAQNALSPSLRQKAGRRTVPRILVPLSQGQRHMVLSDTWPSDLRAHSSHVDQRLNAGMAASGRSGGG